MHNSIELVALAERAGLGVVVSRSPLPGSIPPSFINRMTGEREEDFSVCVAALSDNHEARVRPFNFRSDPSAPTIEGNIRLLLGAAGRLSPGGLMFIYGLPQHLPRYATALSGELAFRYWIAARAATATAPGGLRPEHSGLLLLSRPGAAINRIRIPHARCRCCGETLKDWGGKSHLMNPRGALLSDVWMDLVVSPADEMPPEIFERILELASDGRRLRGTGSPGPLRCLRLRRFPLPIRSTGSNASARTSAARRMSSWTGFTRARVLRFLKRFRRRPWTSLSPTRPSTSRRITAAIPITGTKATTSDGASGGSSNTSES